ncbi:hypothetical protein NEUTE2DRAFT_61813 [Neurospora tetrasperma FGSC 2509]|nr:hypothetical protein NEUTE2DRAFT_61813 [Neurospora tetrasperma FGSC 2509]
MCSSFHTLTAKKHVLSFKLGTPRRFPAATALGSRQLQTEHVVVPKTALAPIRRLVSAGEMNDFFRSRSVPLFYPLCLLLQSPQIYSASFSVPSFFELTGYIYITTLPLFHLLFPSNRLRTTRALRQQLFQMNSMAEPLSKYQPSLNWYRFRFGMHQQQQQQLEQQQLEQQQLEQQQLEQQQLEQQQLEQQQLGQQQLQPNIYTSSVSRTSSCGASASAGDFWKSSRLIFS